MGAKGDLGVTLELDDVPCRETGMTAYEMMLSESQERMLMVLKPEKEKEAEAIFRKWGLDFAIVGKTTPTKRFIVKHSGKVVADLPIKELGDEAPVYDRPHVETPKQPVVRASDVLPPLNTGDALVKLIGSPDLCSRRWVWEQYDHVILGNTVQRPGGDAAVVRVNDGPKALALTADVTPRYCEADPFEGGKQAVAEAWRNITAVGAKPMAVTDNLNFGNPERPEIMGQLVGCIRGIGEACSALDFPVVSGNVSLYNETNGRAILPTPTIGGVGVLDNFEKSATHCVQGRRPGDPADRRDQGLARPVDLSARGLRAGGGRAAAGRSRRRAPQRRFRARADRGGQPPPPSTTSPTAGCWWRSPRWRWRPASAPSSRRRRWPRMRSGSARIRPAMSSPPIPARRRASSTAPTPPACRRARSAPPAATH